MIEPVIHGDPRGFFTETYRSSTFAQLGIVDEFLQDNHSRSARGVLRGMHFQIGRGTAKLVFCARGTILDVVVDLRRGSPSYGGWEAVVLDDVDQRLLYVPIGFAHGFCVLSDWADVIYKQTDYFDPDLERGIAYDDPEIGIEWPEGVELQVSDRDATAPRLSDISATLPFEYSAAD